MTTMSNHNSSRKRTTTLSLGHVKSFRLAWFGLKHQKSLSQLSTEMYGMNEWMNEWMNEKHESIIE